MVRWTAYKIYPDEFINNNVENKALTIEGKKIHRVRLLGEVKNISVSTILSFELDGVTIKDFEKKAENDISMGDFVDVIGRVGEYEGSKYVSLEVYKKRNMDREKWRELRSIEIEKTRRYMENEDNILSDSENIDNSSIADDVLEDIYGNEQIDKKDIILKAIDEAEELSYEELLNKTGIDEKELDNILEELIEDGEIYEPKLGTYRIL